MDIKMVDVMIHVDESLDEERRHGLVETVRRQEGVVAIGYHDEQPHLMVIEYNPGKTDSAKLLDSVKAEGVHAELVGL